MAQELHTAIIFVFSGEAIGGAAVRSAGYTVSDLLIHGWKRHGDSGNASTCTGPRSEEISAPGRRVKRGGGTSIFKPATAALSPASVRVLTCSTVIQDIPSIPTMNRLISILAAIAVLLIQNRAIAGEPSNGPGKTAEQFYAGYLVLVNTEKHTRSWVARSQFATKSFKKWYAKQMDSEAVDADVVLQANDTPTTPFKAIKTTINADGTKATVILKTKYSNDTEKLSIHMVLTDGVWKLDSLSAVK